MKLLPEGEATIVVLAGLCLAGLGAFMESVYCEWRRASEVQQLSHLTGEALRIGVQCIGTLGEVVPGALVLASQKSVATGPRIMRDSAMRDSLRNLRWSTP